MVLSSRYAKAKDFYVSRALRIFPPYFVALIGTIAACLLTGVLFQNWMWLTAYAAHPLSHNGEAGVAIAAASNLSLFGQDWMLFLSQDLGQPLSFTSDFRTNQSPLWRYLLVPQCWSVGIELMFYLVSPVLNRLSSFSLTIIAVCALAARWFCYSQLGLDHDPWTYRFFPFESSLFIFGMLGYRLYLRMSVASASHHPCSTSRGRYIINAAILVLLLAVHAHLVSFVARFAGVEITHLIFYPLWVPVIAFLFLKFGSQRDDRFIGELSYPIYLVHEIVITLVFLAMRIFSIPQSIDISYAAVASAAISIVISLLFYRLLISPLDRRRHALASVPA